MSPIETPPALLRVWARPGETLTTHTVEVFERVRQLSRMRPLADERFYARLGWAALLHDSGKLAGGFQRSLKKGAPRWGLRHEVLSLAFLEWFTFQPDDRLWIAAAIATHHRDLPYIRDRYLSIAGDEDDPAPGMINEVNPDQALAWYDWLGRMAAAHEPALLSAPQCPFIMPRVEAIHAALRDLARWQDDLYERGTAHPDFISALLTRGTILLADHAGSAQARAFVPVRSMVDRLTGAGSPLENGQYAHQAACAAHSGESALLLAPTGSGKTAAALLWATSAAVTPPRLLYLLPYRASIEAMTRTLERFAPQEDIGLQHGRALQALYRRLLEDRAAPDAAREAEARLNLARLHTYPIRVTTPYHLLRAAYQLKGFEALLTDLYGARIIVDEIHAYEPKRLAMIVEMLALLRERFDVKLLIMTATLPPVIAEVLEQSLPGLQVIMADEAVFNQFTRHQIRIETGDLANVLPQIIDQAKQGHAVLVTVNTVKRARQISHKLREAGAEVLTLHSRFTARDRWQHEQQLLKLFHTGRQCSGHLPIVVATQVIEVSLDLDFDTIYTDPAPLDALLQRFGRVNRMRRTALAPVHIFTEPTGSGDRHPIYDPALVQTTIDVLRARDGQSVDERALSAWLGEAYVPVIDSWRAQYEERRAHFRRFVLGELRPFDSADEGLFRSFMKLFDGLDVLPLDLDDEYQALVAEDPLAADSLFVPITYWQYKMLERKERAWPETTQRHANAPLETRYYTDLPYDPEAGLLFDEGETTFADDD